MKGKLFRHRIGSGIPLGRLDEPPSDNPQLGNVAWHQIALEGEWKGHAMGAFKLDRRMFDEMVLHHDSEKVDTVVDYEHATFWGSMCGQKAPASGWIKAMQVRAADDGQVQLWAQFHWTNTAAAHIREGEYRYLSPVIVFRTRQRESGEMGGASIHSVALTNTPFLQELPDLRLNSLLPCFEMPGRDIEEEDPMDETQFKALCAKLGLTATATVDEVMAAADKAAGMAQTGAAVLEQLGLAVGTPKDAAVTTVLKLQNPARDETAIVALQTEVAELRADRARRNAEGLVATALAEGKLTAPGTPQHDWALAFAAKDPAEFAAWSKTAPKVVPTARVNRDPKAAAGAVVLDEEQREINRQAGISDEDFLKYQQI